MVSIQYAFLVYGPGTDLFGKTHSQSLDLHSPLQGVHKYQVLVHDVKGRKATIDIYTAQEILPTFQEKRRLADLHKLKVPAAVRLAFATAAASFAALAAALALLGALLVRRQQSLRTKTAGNARVLCPSRWRIGRPPDGRDAGPLLCSGQHGLA